MGVLLERDVFVSTLRGYIDDAAQGQGRLILVCGEAGVGKTELLETVRAGTPEGRWLWSACDALSTPRPLGPLHDAEARARQCLRAAGVSVPSGRRAATRANAAGLTPREQEVLDLLAEDLANAEIARQLVLSERTVDHHVSAVLRKLAVSSRSAATARARELGLVSAEK